MKKHSISQVKTIIKNSLKMMFERVQNEVILNEDIRLQVLDTMKENDIGYSIMHQAGITAKMLGVEPKEGRPNGPKRDV
jgi:hypothetical protein